MLIIRKNQTNNLIATVSMNKTLPNPYYLFSFQHIASKERVSFIPEVITSNVRYDKFRFIENQTTNLSLTPPRVFFEYLGQYYYSIYEQISSGNTDPSLAYNKLESGRAWVILGNDDMDECFFEPYISNDEDFAQVIYVSDEEEACIYPTPSITPSPTATPVPPSPTPTNTTTPSQTPTNTATPSQTPTNTSTPTTTPTPSSTPPSSFTPATLGALWWVDFTDAATLTTGFGYVLSALDKISNVPFTAGVNGPVYNPTGYLGLSGTARTNAIQLATSSGAYGSFSEYTWFLRMYDDATTQRGGKMITATNNGVPWPAGQAFLIFSDNNLFPYPPGPVWRAFMRLSGGGQQTVDFNITFSAWTDVAVRVYNSGMGCELEVWENGSIIASSNEPFDNVANVNNPIFSLLFDGGVDFNTEQFFFDRKLNNTEMAQMFSYLTNKY